MKVLFVDQLSHVEGKNAYYLARKINHLGDDLTVELFFSITDKNDYIHDEKTKIIFEFGDAYHGNIFKKAIAYIKSLKKIKKYIKANHVDILVLQWFSIPWIENHFIKRVKKYCRVVTIVHDVVPFNNRVNEQSALKKIYNLSDTLVVHSKRAMSELIRLYSLKKDIEVVSGAFCDKEIYKSESKEISRENLGINKDSFVVLFYGSIRESKGLDILLEAIQIANKKNPKVFLLAGGSLQGISKERERVYRDLASAVNSENIGDVKFEFVPIELEKYYFCASDVLCLPYRNGWQSGVAQLGLVYELPIIASDIDEMKEVVLNECNGLLFENNNPSDLANKIFYLSTNPKKQTIFKNNSSKIYMERFDLINKAKDFAEIFRKLYEPK